MRAKFTALIFGSALGLSAANAGTLQITESTQTDNPNTYTLENPPTAIIQLGSISDENVTLEPSTVDSGNGSNTHDLTDDMPDGNVYVTLVDGDEITTRICSDDNAEEASSQ